MDAPALAAEPTGRAIGAQAWAELRAEADPGETSEVLLAYQRRLLETTSAHQVTVCEKSRRTGMTWAAAADAVLTASAERAASGMDVLYMGYNLDMAREFIDTAATWAESFKEALSETGVQPFLFDDDGQPIQAFRIAFASGYEIVALSSKPRSLRGRQGYLILDEAAFHDQLQQVVDAAVPFLMWGGKILVISTHFGEANAFNRMIEDARAGRKPYAVLRVTLDDALHDGLFRRICEKQGKPWSAPAEAAWRANLIAAAGDAADEEFFCVPSQGGGAVLSGALIEARMSAGIPVLRLEKPTQFGLEPEHVRRAEIEQWCEANLRPVLEQLDPRLHTSLGGDFGRVADLTVFWPLQTTRNMQRITPFVVELRNIPFEQQWQIGCYICDRLPHFSAAKFDAIGIGAQLAESFAQRYGAELAEPVKLSATWYVENVPALRASFEDAGIVIPQDLDIKKDLQLPVMRGGVPTIPPVRTVGMDGKKRHGDSFVALLLAHAASRAEPVTYGYRAARREDVARASHHDDDDRRRSGGMLPRLRGGL
ncbi:terminase large subunit domain-containing protein [Azorhizobium caulinodans]|uniref:terminase large subunit domain-containing protein n=1 Tax=Azorhizobium caulinodans TaxID=7 RepID=UPI002FBEC845